MNDMVERDQNLLTGRTSLRIVYLPEQAVIGPVNQC
jgi:hypothetical protein